MANQVKNIEVGFYLIFQFVKNDSLIFKLLDYRLFLLGIVPGFQETVQRAVRSKDSSFCVFLKAAGNQLSVGVKKLLAFAEH